jgi:hypothetical protein
MTAPQLDLLWRHYSAAFLGWQAVQASWWDTGSATDHQVSAMRGAKEKADTALMDYLDEYDRDQRERFPDHFRR